MSINCDRPPLVHTSPCHMKVVGRVAIEKRLVTGRNGGAELLLERENLGGFLRLGFVASAGAFAAGRLDIARRMGRPGRSGQRPRASRETPHHPMRQPLPPPIAFRPDPLIRSWSAGRDLPGFILGMNG